MVQIHSTIRVLFVATLTVLTIGISATVSLERTITLVESRLSDANSKLLAYNNLVQAITVASSESFSNVFEIHNAASDLDCSLSRANVALWTTSTEGEYDGKSVLAFVVVLQSVFLQALKTLTAAINKTKFLDSSAHGAAAIILEDLIYLNMSSSQLMFGLIYAAPNDEKEQAISMNDDMTDAFAKAIGAYTANSTVPTDGNQ